MKAHGANLPDGANLPAVPQSRTYFNLSRSLGLGSACLLFRQIQQPYKDVI